MELACYVLGLKLQPLDLLFKQSTTESLCSFFDTLTHMQAYEWTHIKCLFVFVALRPMLTAMVIAGRSVHLTTLFPGQT